MKSIDSDDLAGRISAALETMCFVIADPATPDELGDLDLHSAIAIESTDPAQAGDSMTMSVSASEGLLTEIACGLMGVEMDELEEGSLAATVLELANIFSGEVITAIGGEELPYRPGIPEGRDGSPSLDAASTVVALDAMGDGLLVTLEPRSA